MSDQNCQPGADDTNTHERLQEESLRSAGGGRRRRRPRRRLRHHRSRHRSRRCSPRSSLLVLRRFFPHCLSLPTPPSLTLSPSLLLASLSLLPRAFSFRPLLFPPLPSVANPPRPSRSHARRPHVRNEVGWRYYGLVRAIQPRQLPFFLTRGGQLLTGTAFLRASMPRLSPLFLYRLPCPSLSLILSFLLSHSAVLSSAIYCFTGGALNTTVAAASASASAATAAMPRLTQVGG